MPHKTATNRMGSTRRVREPYKEARVLTVDTLTARLAPQNSRRTVLLGLAPLAIFAWQFVFTHSLLENPFGSMSIYYLGRGTMAFVAALAFLKKPLNSMGNWSALSLPAALVAGTAPFVLVFGPRAASAAHAVAFLAGAASTWLYLSVFLTYAATPLKHALLQLLGALSFSYFTRMALGFLPGLLLPVLGAALPFVCVTVCRWGYTTAQRSPQGAVTTNHTPQSPFWLFVLEFAVFGFAAGLVRTPYEMSQFGTVVNTFGSLLLAVAIAAFLWWAYIQGDGVHLSGVCHLMLLLLLTVLLAIALFGAADSPIAAIASLFARFGVYMLLLYVLCVFVSRGTAHPYVTFGFGWGFFSLATGLGIAVATINGTSVFSSVTGLAIAYALVIVSLFVGSKAKDCDSATSAAPAAEPKLAGESGIQDLGAQMQEEILHRCEDIGRSHGLTPREIEVMQLISLGRSKGYIAQCFSITENTARGYAKNVYRKLDIHSRQELLSLIGIK